MSETLKISKFPTLFDVIQNYCNPDDVRDDFPEDEVDRDQAKWLVDYVWKGMNMDDSDPDQGASRDLREELEAVRLWANS